MRGKLSAMALGVTLSAVLGGTAPALAQATRTWVSGVGDDANPCSRTAPCKTFAGAISKTAAGGEIDAIDPGGFGAVTITKSITIDGTGPLASVLASGTNGIIINAAATDRVVIRNVSINGAPGTGLNGIRFIAGEALHVEGCTISNFSGSGIRVENGGQIFVRNTSLRNNVIAGIALVPATGTVHVMVDGASLEGNGTGVLAQGNVVATIRGSTAAGNDGAGFSVDGAGVEVNLERSAAVNNATGIFANNSARVRFTDMTVAGNTAAGLQAQNAGEIAPFTDNLIAGNPPGAGGAPICQLAAASSAVPCPDVAPVCEAPVIGPGIGPCKRCRTKNGVTTCSSCTIAIQ